MSRYFQDKVAVVTGAASGFGLEISRRLLQERAKAVYMGDFNELALTRQSGLLSERYPGRVFPVLANSAKREDVENLVNMAAQNAGSLDFIFNNAGRPMTKPTEDITVEEFNSLIDLNLKGVVYGVLTALPIMLAQGNGHIVNTSSVGGLLPTPFQTAYAATKSAVVTMTRCMSYEYAGTDIHFSHICPTNVATRIFSAQLAEEMRQRGKCEEEIEKILSEAKPPQGAMPLDEAIDYVFEELERKSVDIIFGQDGRDGYELFCKNKKEFDNNILKLADARREFYAAVKRGEPAVFPG